MKAIEKAASGFDRGLNCSQSMVDAFAERFGCDVETARRLGRGLGMGLGSGSVCGAASGAVMVLGMATGTATDKDGERAARFKSYDLAREFIRRFQDKHGSIECRTLIGVDLTTKEGDEEARQKNLFKTICQPLVKSSAEILDELLIENGFGSKNNI
jgi:C_GCAxxG_C_C family probable redox protein